MLGAIDIHHHFVPERIIGEAKRHGAALGVRVSEEKDGSPRFAFDGGAKYALQAGLTDVEPRFRMMEQARIAFAALDPSTNLIGYELRGERAESWCRLYNQCVSEFVQKYPDRFTAMAAVPLQEPARAARVLEHAVAELGFRGAYIPTNIHQRYYESEEFDSFWAKAQELDALVFMHPENPAGTELMAPFGLRLVCGNPADTTLSLGILIYSGVFDRFPNLKLCACHGGGFFPYHVSRFDREFLTGKQATRRADRPKAPRCAAPPSAYLKNLYFDTLVYDGDTLDFLRRKVGADHLMLGTDFPYLLGDWQGVEKIEALPCVQEDKSAILEGNARKLLKLAAL